ncbi:MAG: peptidoglycan DD-metalloendopeptidase family protein [Saprospiraceae bacterium]
MKQFIFSALMLFVSASALQAQTYAFPFKGEDLAPGVRISTGTHASGIQGQGRDIGAKKYLGNSNWTGYVDGNSSNKANDNHVIYGQEFYAMADGEVCGCWRNAPENPKAHLTERHPDFDKKLIIGGGNHLWIKHADGSYALYAHAITGSIPSSICPNNKTIFDKPHSGYYGAPDIATEVLIPEGSRPKVKKGQFLGKVGNSGASSGPHLHVHIEKNGKSMPMTFERGLSKSRTGDKADINGGWTRFAGKTLPEGEILIFPARTVTSEYSRHGLPDEDFQRMFDHLADSGFEPDWIDGYSVNGNGFYNMTWSPKEVTWSAFAGLSSAAYQTEFDKAKNAGLAPTFVDGYALGGSVRYNAIFKKVGGGYIAKHGISAAQHDATLNDAKNQGLDPVNISVASVNNQLAYTVLYRSNNIGQWQVKSQVKESDYQALFNTNNSNGLMPVYLNGYRHGSENYLSCVFASKSGTWDARHAMDINTYQTEWQNNTSAGFLTKVCAGMDGNGSHRFAGVWRK